MESLFLLPERRQENYFSGVKMEIARALQLCNA